jgi:hypothetical protein
MKVCVHWVTLMKNQNIEKFQSLIFLMANIFFKPFGKTIMFNGFKMSNFSCRSHVQKIILSKKHVRLSIETHFGIL